MGNGWKSKSTTVFILWDTNGRQQQRVVSLAYIASKANASILCIVSFANNSEVLKVTEMSENWTTMKTRFSHDHIICQIISDYSAI